jgi:hypothetical protein
MAHTRISNDPARIAQQLHESTFSGRYMLNKPGNAGPLPTFYADPQIRMTHWGANLLENPVDVASELDGRMGVQTKYGVAMPERGTYRSAAAGAPTDHSEITHQTRSSHPTWMLREQTRYRWDMPIHDPQRYIWYGVPSNTRLEARDAVNYSRGPRRPLLIPCVCDAIGVYKRGRGPGLQSKTCMHVLVKRGGGWGGEP